MDFKIIKMNSQDARSIIKWKYPKPYDLYNMDDTECSFSELLNGSYYSVYFDNLLYGFYCFGKSAQVPIKETLDLYNEKFLDIGIGMNPLLVNKGLGSKVLYAGLEYARKIIDINNLRITVASFNERAIKVYKKSGFEITDSFNRQKDNTSFYIMTKVDIQ